MLSRLSSHISHNVVGYLALFFALTGVAYAAGPLKSGDPAGGDLAGSYPNPSVASGAVDTANFSSTIPAARAIAGSSQTIPSSSVVVLNFATEVYDTADLYSSSTNPSRLTAPVAGIYRIAATGIWDSFSSTGSRRVWVEVNGETAHNTVVAPSSAVFTQSLSTDLELAAGDYVEVLALQDSGSDNAISTRSFTMSWVAPGSSTATSPQEGNRQDGIQPKPDELESRYRAGILSPDELHRTPAPVYETEGHRFESCRARSWGFISSSPPRRAHRL